eukprot:1159205-Pelagomonas_calceolata.AAC.9
MGNNFEGLAGCQPYAPAVFVTGPEPLVPRNSGIADSAWFSKWCFPGQFGRWRWTQDQALAAVRVCGA